MGITGNLPNISAIDWSASPAAPLLLLMALAVDALIGDPRWLPHPVRLMGALTGFLDARLNRAHRSALDRMIRGFVAVVIVVGITAALGWAISVYAAVLSYGWVIELALVAMLLAQRDMIDHTLRVMRALRNDGLDGARLAVRQIVGRDVALLDAHGVARATIESCAENHADGVVAPVFWYLLLGLPGLMAYKAINTMDSMIGHRTERHGDFGMVAARLDDAVNWLPARLSGLLLAAAALFVPGASPVHALVVMFRDARKHVSPNAGWPEAAVAGALDLALLGPRRYEHEAPTGAWLGDGRAKATATDIRRTVMLFIVAGVIGALLVAVIALAAQAV